MKLQAFTYALSASEVPLALTLYRIANHKTKSPMDTLFVNQYFLQPNVIEFYVIVYSQIQQH